MHEYASGVTLVSTLAKLGLEQSTVTKSETQKILSLDGLHVLVNDNDVTLPIGDTVLNGATLFVLCGDRLESTNAGTMDHLLDEEGVYHFKHEIDVGHFVTADARATVEDAGVVLFLKDASAKTRWINTSSSPMEVSPASSLLANEEVGVQDMRVPATNLPKDAPQLDKCKLR